MLLLDLDRTLVDLQSFTDYERAWADIKGVVAELDALPATTWPSATRACMGAIASLTDVDRWHEVSAVIAAHERAAIPQSQPMPGLAEFWATTADRSRAVVTLLPTDVATELLAQHGVEPDLVVGRDPLIRPKPAPDGLEVALRAAGVRAEAAVMIGDSSWDALAAAAAGVRFVGVHAPDHEFAGIVPAPPVVSGLLAAVALLDR